MRIVSGMTIEANRKEVLEKLIENRKMHSKIVAEARKGYVEKAKEALLKRLKQIESGKIAGLNFDLYAPQDYTKVYDTAIKMLEMHTEETIELQSEQVRCLVMDEWDWSNQFIASNAAYSETAAHLSNRF